jgi:hypothetical protein
MTGPPLGTGWDSASFPNQADQHPRHREAELHFLIEVAAPARGLSLAAT